MSAVFSLSADTPQHSLEEVYPPFGLRIESPRLILRQLRETDFPAYLAAASSGLRNTEQCPFLAPWDENSPEKMARESLAFIYSKRGQIGPDEWNLALAVFSKDHHGAEGPLIGFQDVSAQHWRTLRTVTSGSWMRRDQQGAGLGSEMRAAVLMWAFDHFGAQYAESSAYDWNEPSQRVSQSLGYIPTGTQRVPDAYGEQPTWLLQFRLSARDFLRPRWSINEKGTEQLQAFYAHREEKG